MEISTFDFIDLQKMQKSLHGRKRKQTFARSNIYLAICKTSLYVTLMVEYKQYSIFDCLLMKVNVIPFPEIAFSIIKYALN